MQAESHQALRFVLHKMRSERETLLIRRDGLERDLDEANAQITELDRRCAAIEQDLASGG